VHKLHLDHFLEAGGAGEESGKPRGMGGLPKARNGGVIAAAADEGQVHGVAAAGGAFPVV
jgi:hypothetical protein